MENAAQSELSQELARIIACPYPASLITLSNILARADDRLIRTCLHHLSPCAIIRLASIVAASLPLWSYSLRTLHALCHSLEFRNVLLNDNPGLLDALLAKANTSQRDFEEYNEICVLLLSSPLPESAPLPGSAQTFFLHLFERAVKSPNVDTLKPVYACLNGACRGLLSLLSAEARHSFDLELRQILQSSSTGQDSMLLLWCFGIVILSEHPQHVGETRLPGAAEVNPDKQWKTASGRKLFGSAKSLSTAINLTYLSVIWASKGEVGVSDSEAIEGIRIATRAMQFIDRDVREGWSNSNNLARSTAAKLVTKILRKGIDAGVQLEALSFYSTMVGEHNLPTEVITQYEAALLKMKTLHTSTDSLRETLLNSLPVFAPHLRESTIRQLFADILNVSSSAAETFEMWNILTLLKVLTAIIPSSASLCSQVLSALSSNELQDIVQSFLQAPLDHHCAGTEEGCDSPFLLLRRTLQSATISMLLTTAVVAQSGGGLSQALAIALISKQQNFTRFSNKCNHSKTSMHSTVSLFEQGCTQSTGMSQQDWRDHLKLEISRQNSYQQDTVIRSVAQICEDLESRCNNVEEPLRREQAKVQDLTAQVSHLHEQVHSLETEAIDRQLYADGFEAELGNVENERQELLTKLAELRSDLAQANREADNALRVAQEQFSAKELEFRSTILTYEEDLHSRGQKIEDLDVKIQELEDKLQNEHVEKAELFELHTVLKAKFDALEHDLESERQNIAQQAEEISQLKGWESSLEDHLAATKRELEATINQRNGVQEQHQELVRSSEKAFQDLEAKYTDAIEAAASKAKEEHDRLHAELQNVITDRKDARTAYEDTHRDLQLAHTTISTLEDKVHQLTDICAEKDSELDELQSWKGRVLQSMGLPTEDKPRSNKTRHLPNTQSGTQKPVRQHRPRKSMSQPMDTSPVQATAGFQGITNTAMENIANASFSSSDSSDRNGSTPKRSKPRPSFTIPDMYTPHKNPGLTHKSASKYSSQAKRTALRTVSPNRRHTIVGFAISENEEYEDQGADAKRRGSLQTREQEAFDMDGFLGGTPFTPGHCSTQREPEEEETGEQTTEL